MFRSDDMGGWSKALWVIFIIILPFLRVLIYLIARGESMQERGMKQYAHQQKAQQAYIRDVAGRSGGNSTEEIATLAQLRDQGVLTEDEFQAQKARAFA